MMPRISGNLKNKISLEIANKLLKVTIMIIEISNMIINRNINKMKSLNRIILKVELRKMLRATAWMKILIIFRATVDFPK
jgi:hypothetical protein